MTLNEVLENLESTANNIFSISSHFRQLSNPEIPDSLELLAEKMAFSFSPDYNAGNTDWGTYYGPEMIFPNNDGTANIWPHYLQITQETLTYWEKRAYECTNPIMSARYADLVYDFQYKCIKTKPNHKVIRKCITDYLLIANNRLSLNELEVYKFLERALNIALSIGDIDLVQSCKKAIIEYELFAAKDNAPGLWGYSFDLLITNPKISVTKEEEREIIEHLEGILIRVTATDNTNAWAAENAVKMLGKYYNSKGDKKNLKRVLEILENAHRETDDRKSTMQTEHWLKEISEYYGKYGFSNDYERIMIELRAISSGIHDEMQSIPFEFSITKEEMDNIVEPYTSGTINEIFIKLMIGWVPKKGVVKKQVLKEKNSFLSIINTIIYDNKGRAIGSLGSIDDNIDRHIVYKTSQQIRLEAIFFNRILNVIVEKHKNILDEMVVFLQDCPIIQSDRIEIIKRGLRAHFEEDYYVSMHLLIPQIEEAIRYMIESSGGNILRPNKNTGGYNLRTFDELLQNEMCIRILGDDLVNYFRTLFTDQFGWNLRNEIMHGFADPKVFNLQTSERVIHALLCLKRVVRKK